MLSLRSWKQNAANSCWGAVVLTVSFKLLKGMYDETLANTSKQSTQQRGKKKEQREKTKVQAQRTKSKVGHKRAKEQIMFRSPH